MKLTALTAALLTMHTLASAAPLEHVALWPEGVPGEADLKLPAESV